MNKHLSENQLTSYVCRILTDVQRETMDNHLGVCSVCRARMGEYQALHRQIGYSIMDRRIAGSRSSQANFAKVAPRLRRSRRFAVIWKGSRQFIYNAAALGVLVALAVGLVLYFGTIGQPDVGPTSVEAMYKGGPQRTGVYEGEGPKRGELKWKFATQGVMWAAPTVLDRVAYVGSQDGFLYAVDIQTGQEKWKFDAGRSVVSTPAVTDETIYFGSGCAGLECRRGPGSDYYFYALDRQTGQELWRFKTGGGMASSPLLVDGVLYFGSEDEHLYAVDSQTGQELWRFKSEGIIFSSPALAGGLIYFGSGCDCFPSEDEYLYAVDRQTGQEKWRFKTGNWVETSPAVADGIVYFGSGDQHVYALDGQTGQELWRFKADEVVKDAVSVSAGVVYAGGGDGNLYAIDSQTGQELWRFATGGEMLYGPAIADGVIYFGGEDRNLYAVDSQTGEELWSFKARGTVYGRVIADGVVYFVSDDLNLYAVGDPQQ
jgi:outer membrane protein assembly factor BamB